MKYVATFYTHVSAMMSQRSLAAKGIRAKLAPTPRELSSSCGTCVRYEADDPSYSLLDSDVEQVASLDDSGYRILRQFS
ncbi:MAG: DUF3343 domain-containing protein [Clostridia bacterium]|nr:DUF3343 domain-containing protein [Clostridia bacterium]MBQ6426092.1 DUF3343 domain-containing protein [Clostridia bacterium]MBR0445419.1 DUF3343 domain-containing protein [Clostridia bacterium]